MSGRPAIATGRASVTLALIAFEQERFVAKAVDGALAQTYVPLEILLSDDASRDGSFAVMRAKAAAYRGPHQVILNRNPANLGLGAHVNRLMELARGELLVVAAGDDVSLPERTARLVAAWDGAGRPAGSIFSDVLEIDEDERPLYEGRRASHATEDLARLLDGARSPVIGCAHAWHRRVFDVFGPLREGVVNEDSAIFFRSALLGSVIHVPEILVHHRLHRGNIGTGGRGEVVDGAGLRAYLANAYRRGLALHRNLEADLDTFEARFGPAPHLAGVRRRAVRNARFHERAGALLSQPVLARIAAAPAVLRLSPDRQASRVFLTQVLWPGAYLFLRRLLGPRAALPPGVERPPAPRPTNDRNSS